MHVPGAEDGGADAVAEDGGADAAWPLLGAGWHPAGPGGGGPNPAHADGELLDHAGDAAAEEGWALHQVPGPAHDDGVLLHHGGVAGQPAEDEGEPPHNVPGPNPNILQHNAAGLCAAPAVQNALEEDEEEEGMLFGLAFGFDPHHGDGGGGDDDDDFFWTYASPILCCIFAALFIYFVQVVLKHMQIAPTSTLDAAAPPGTDTAHALLPSPPPMDMCPAAWWEGSPPLPSTTQIIPSHDHGRPCVLVRADARVVQASTTVFLLDAGSRSS
ncbi:hypothetical protein ACP4OV_010037 [Aristida adscensionis]